MRSHFYLLPVLIGIIVLLSGCNKNKYPVADSKSHEITILTEHNKPASTFINPEDLIIKIPGQGNVELPKKVISELPEKLVSHGNNKVIPGLSILKQTINEKLLDEPTVLSKKPTVISYSSHNFNNVIPVKHQEVRKTKLLKNLYIDRDSLNNSRDFALKNNLYYVYEDDTIIPPFSIKASSPLVTKSLPFYYKENALIDISILETSQELPNPYIRSIAMDNQDVMWFLAHSGGLIYYDGIYFKEYFDPRRQTAQTGLSMIIDSSGKIWIGTKDGGLYCFDGEYTTQYTIDQGFMSLNINALVEGEPGVIWCASTDGLIKVTDSTITTYTSKDGLAFDYCYSITKDNNGNIWVGTFGGGVSMFNGNEFTNYTEQHGLCHNRVLSVAQDSKGNYWFGTYGGGVSKFDGKTFKNYTVEQGLGSNVILSIKEDAQNKICFGTYGHGVTFFDGKSFTNYTTHEGLSYDYIRTLTNDNKGNLWIGTDGSGISKVNLNGFNLYTTNSGLLDNNIGAIYQDNSDRLIFAPFEGGVSIFDPLETPGQLDGFYEINSSHGLSFNIVTAICQDSNNNYWFGTFGGGISMLQSNSLQTGKLRFTNYDLNSGLNSQIIRATLLDNKGNIWIASEGGATKFDGRKFTTYTTDNGLGNNKVLTIHQDKLGRMWFGTMDGGVSCLDNDTITTYTTEQGLAGNTVWTISEDKNGYLWFGTERHGISGFNGFAFRNINAKNGLTSNDVFSAIIDDKNNLWAGTIKGLNRIALPGSDFFDPKKNDESIEIVTYYRSDGLIGLDFSSNSVLIDNMNCIWWGTDKALTMLDLGTFKSFSEPPNPILNKIKINNQEFDFSENCNDRNNSGISCDSLEPFSNIPIGLNLPYNLNYLSFSFVATDWSSLNQISYQYKVEGFDSDWSNPSKENSADYRNLPPGKYIFKLKARGKSGNWSKSLEYPFIIRSPWYLTLWAGLLYLVVLAFTVWLIVKWRVSIVKRQKKVLSGMVNEKTKDLDRALVLAEQASEAKNQFIATISHELRTPLNAIMGLSHLANTRTKDNDQKDYLKKIDRSAGTLLNIINEILDFSKIEAGKLQLENTAFNIDDVVNSIVELNAQSAKDKNLDFVVNVSQEIPQYLVGDPLRIGQVITNLCNNAIKFTSIGEVVVSIELEEIVNSKDIFIQVSVKDTGIGISEDEMGSLFDKFKQADASTTRKYGGTGLGLSICKLIIEMMEGQIWLESEVGKGTTFFFDFKVQVQEDKELSKDIIPEELLQYNILVCDNNKEIRKSIQDVLSHYSLNVIGVPCGEDVVKLVKENQIDLLIIDLKMKEMSGIETILTIRSDENIPPVKTIVLTDSLTDKESLESNIAGIDGFILKPATPSYIIEKVLTVFGMDVVKSNSEVSSDEMIEVLKSHLSGRKVLIAEDNELNQQVLVELIQRTGMNINCVENGKQAVDKVENENYDIILLDIHMPVLDGFSAASELRNKGVDIPIIAITADAMDTIKSKIKGVGINDIITKPINPDILYNCLLKWITGKDPIKIIEKSFTRHDSLDLPGISSKDLDISAGIRRLGNDKRLYYNMLEKFLLNSGDTIKQLTTYIKDNDIENATLCAHSMKGESGNLGVIEVSRIAGELQNRISNKDEKITDKLLKELAIKIEKLHPVMDELKSQKSKVVSVSEFRPRNQIVDEIITCIGIKDPKLFDLLDELEESGIIKADLIKIRAALKEGDIKLSVTLLKELS